MTEDQFKTSQALKCYLATVDRIKGLEQERVALNAQMEGLSAQKLDGLPKAPGFHRSDKVEKILDKLSEIECEILKELDALNEKRKKIDDILKHVEDPTLRRVLEMRYLERGADNKPNSWETICFKMGYSWAQIHRLHKRALDAVKRINDDTQ